MSSSSPRIAIVGGGPAGLVAGLLLHQHGIPITIFELRQEPTGKELAEPSGSLDLHDESGQAAIKECGLWDQFLPLTGQCSEADMILDMAGQVLYSDQGEQSDRPEIARHDLIKLLLSHLPAETIKWGHKLVSTKSTTASDDTTETELDFGSHGGKHTFDLVVGADGAWSRIRPLLTDTKPHYTGRQCITLTIRQATAKYPRLAQLVGNGTCAALGLRHSVTSQRGAQDSARIYLFLTAGEDFAAETGMAGQTAAVAKARLLADDALFGRWGDSLKELIGTACDEDAVDHPGANIDIKPLYTLPVGISWEPRPGVTAVGDAAHLMGPWAGEGVNLAMWDAMLLARAVIEAYQQSSSPDALPFQRVFSPLVKEFEADMVARSTEKAEMTFKNGEMMFRDNAAREFADLFLSMGQ